MSRAIPIAEMAGTGRRSGLKIVTKFGGSESARDYACLSVANHSAFANLELFLKAEGFLKGRFCLRRAEECWLPIRLKN